MGAWTEIVDFTVPSNTTSFTLNNFGTITKDDFIKVVMTFVNADSNNTAVHFLGNTSTLTNYHHQRIESGGTSVSAVRANFNFFSYVSPNQTGQSISYVKLSENDRLNTFSNITRRNDSSIENWFLYNTSSGATFTSGITSIKIDCDRTNGIGTGTRIQIYRLDAEKVADFVTTSNSTQVDIPVTGSLDPAITKDSEYLLVSDVLADNIQGGNYRLFANDNTTAADYHSQRIQGNGSTANAARENEPNYFSVDSSGNRTLTYSHIKLSEIGAFTSQNYAIELYGSSSVRIRNRFNSSTAENITSITKLNIAAVSPSRIGSGSRFILYKLK
jgi:hypothetical protein